MMGIEDEIAEYEEAVAHHTRLLDAVGEAHRYLNDCKKQAERSDKIVESLRSNIIAKARRGEYSV